MCGSKWNNEQFTSLHIRKIKKRTKNLEPKLILKGICGDIFLDWTVSNENLKGIFRYNNSGLRNFTQQQTGTFKGPTRNNNEDGNEF